MVISMYFSCLGYKKKNHPCEVGFRYYENKILLYQEVFYWSRRDDFWYIHDNKNV